ncbi:MAG TPA: NUDIX domain-containing protein [Candidatus Paceibacterota bacterium]|nr:NUDIX domain-containing protein [Candidatus Paceibacterota bacterium]
MGLPSVGVVVGRFQVPYLHRGHLHVLNTARDNHAYLLVVLASTGGQATRENPLPFEARRDMMKSAYPRAKILEIFDHPINPTFWSRDLDALIRKEFPFNPITLYGSRDSFLPLYSGTFPTVELASEDARESGTALRKSARLMNTRDARDAAIWQVNSRYPIAFRTVDIAIERPSTDEVLLIGKNRHEGLLSFPGGHVNVGERDEDAAPREFGEEVPGVEISELTWLGSDPINDPRYRNSTDGITTTFFRGTYLSGTPTAADDADSVHWVKRDALIERLVPWHHTLGHRLLTRTRP